MSLVPFNDLPDDLQAGVVPIDDLPDSLRPQKEVPGYLSNIGSLLVDGGQSTLASARVSPSVIAGNISDNQAGIIAEQLQRPPRANPPELQEIKSAFDDEGEAWKDAEGFWQHTAAVGGVLFEIGRQAITNPKGVTYFSAEQAANTAPSIVGMLAGGAAGAPAGPLGALAGATVGSFSGSAPIEIGSEFIGLVGEELAARELEPTGKNVAELLRDESFIDEAINNARIKGATTAAIDAGFTVASGRLVTAPGRAATRTAVKEGASDSAQVLARRAEILAERTAPQKVGTVGKAVGVDTLGGGASEAGGQLAAYGEIDLAEVGLEMMGELGGAAIQVPAAARAVTAGTRRSATKPALDPQQTKADETARQQAGEAALRNATSADEAIAAANDMAGTLDAMSADIDIDAEIAQELAARANDQATPASPVPPTPPVQPASPIDAEHLPGRVEFRNNEAFYIEEGPGGRIEFPIPSDEVENYVRATDDAPLTPVPHVPTLPVDMTPQLGPPPTPVAGDPMLDSPASWVIRNKETGEVIVETYEQRTVDALNTDKYEAVPIAQHLREINDPSSRASQIARGEVPVDAAPIPAPPAPPIAPIAPVVIPPEATEPMQVPDAVRGSASTQSTTAREMGMDGRPSDGQPVFPGDIFRTLSGRETTPYPKQKSERYASQWLIDNATAEAEARGDDFNAPVFAATTIQKGGRLIPADQEAMLMYLFEHQSDVAPSILRPLSESPASQPVSAPAQASVTSELSGVDVVPPGANPDAGSRATVLTPAGRPVDVRYRVVEASDLVTSNTSTGAINPDYPASLQPRDRSRDASGMQIHDIATNLRPQLLGMSAITSDGAPVVSPEGVVESGNGRTLAIERAYAQAMASAQAYREWLQEQGYNVEGMRAPVLVRQRETPMTDADLQAYTRESNERTTAAMSDTEQARADAESIAPILGDFVGGDVASAANRDFVRKFVRDIVSQSTQGEMMSSDGMLSQRGQRRINAALMSSAYDSPEIVADLFESSESDIKAIGGALLDVAGQWAQMRESARVGAIPASMDITENVVEAVNLIRRARAEGKGVHDIASQIDIMSGQTDPVTMDMLRLFHRDKNLTKARSRVAMATTLAEYANVAQSIPAADNMFGDAPPTGGELLRTINERQRQRETPGEQSGLFEGPRDATQSDGQSGQEGTGSGSAPVRKGARTGDGQGQGQVESRDPLLFGADTGIPAQQVQRMVDRITENLPGSSGVEIRVVRTRLDVDDAEGILPSIGAEGVYIPASDVDGQARPARIYLISQALGSMERAEQVLAHELVGHFGMEAMLGDRFSDVLDDVIRLSRAPEGVDIGVQRVGDPYYATMDAVERDYPDYSPANQAREVLARMAETNVRPHLLELVYAHVRRFLRSLGINAPLSAAEIKKMVVDSAKQLRRTTGQQAVRGSRSAAESLRNSERSQFAAEVMAELQHEDEMFRYPASEGHTLKDVLADIDPSVRYGGFEMLREDERSDIPGRPRQRTTIRTADGAIATLYTTRDEVWIDVSRLQEGERGSAIYAAVADYAYNTGRQFIGDPAGLSDVALRRRTDAMLSSAIKHGSTDHLQPHARQLQGDESLGIPPLLWKNGHYYDNVQSLIETSVASLEHLVPEIRTATFVPGQRAFADGQGRPLSNATLERWRAQGSAGTSSVGRSTIKRGILLNTLLRGEGGPGSELLAQVLRGQQPYVGPDSSLAKIFHSRTDRDPGALSPESTNTQAPPSEGFSDSGRRIDTPEFKRWFSNSKIVNDDGDPKVMYHGTTSSFDNFSSSGRTGGLMFFTPDPSVASEYADGRRSGYTGLALSEARANLRISRDHNRKAFDGDLIKHGISRDDLFNALWDADIGEFSELTDGLENGDIGVDYATAKANEIISDLMGAPGANVMPVYIKAENPYNNQQNPIPWKEAERLGAEYFKSRGNDAVYANEGDGVSLAVFSPSQIKSATGNRGTFDPLSDSILESRAPSDDPRNLFVAHNLSAENILSANEIGGLAAPSIAVGRSDIGFDSFGEVTLLADPALLEDRSIRTFDADIYSPRQPRAHYTLDRDAYYAFEDSLDPDGLSLSKPDINDASGTDGANALLHSDAVRYKFLQEQGQAPKLYNAKVDPSVRRAAKLEGNRHELAQDPKFIKIATDYYRDQVDLAKSQDNVRGERYEGFFFEADGSIMDDAVRKFADMVQRFKDTNGKDVGRLRDDLRKKFTQKKRSNDYEMWVADKFNNMVKGKTLFKGFTNAGNRRYIPYTMDNLVREMTRDLQAGEGMFYGAGTVRSAYANEMRTLRQIQQRRGQIVSEAEFATLRDESNQVLQDALEKLKPYYKFDADSWNYSSDAGSAIAEGLKGLREAFNVTPEVRQIVADLTDYLQAMPTTYFEAKTQRAVGFNEFNTAIVPKGMRRDALQVLRDAGLRIKTYDPKTEGDRARIVTQQQDLLFSMRQEEGEGMGVDALRDELSSSEFGPIVDRLIESGAVEITNALPGAPAGAQAQTNADGTITLSGDSIQAGNAVPVLLHEAFHGRVEPFIGSDNWNRLQDRLGTLYRLAQGSNAKNNSFWRDALARVESAQAMGDQMTQAQAIEEFGAYAIENYEAAPASIRKWVDGVIGSMKAWLLQRFGIQLGGVTPAQLRALAVAALKARDQGGTARTSGRARYSVEGSQQPALNQRAQHQTALDGMMTPEVQAQRRGPTNIFGQPVDPTWEAPAETKMDDVIYTLQDKHIDTRRVVQAIKKSVDDIKDRWNPYLQEELYHGRAAKATSNFLQDELRPLLQDMQLRKVTMQDFETYLHNKHAEERNEQIAAINPAMPDGGSGINTADAQAYLTGLDAKTTRHMEALAKRAQDISAKTRELLVRSGLETQETIDAWEDTYSNYVPLQREDMDFAQGPGTGQGYSVRGSASKRATGSSRNVVDILANIAMQRERAITRAEKNRVAVALYGLATLEPNTDFWMAVNPEAVKDINKTVNELIQMGLNPLDALNLINEPKQAYIDPHTGMVAYRVNPAMRSNGNVMSARVNGQERYVFFNERNPRGQRMVSAMKNLDADQLGTAMGFVAKITRWVAAVNTQYNPIFGIVNFTRDTQAALLQLATTELHGKEATVMRNTLPALRGIYSQIRADRHGSQTRSKWADLWDQFQEAGGKTGYRDQYQRSDERARALEREFKKISEGKAKKAGRAILDWLSDYNDTMENAVRLAAFKTALDNGITPERAASIGKNLTVNFNRKGQIAGQASAMYAFFNAAVQGSTKMIETLAGPTGNKVISGGLLLGVIQALAMSAAGFDDDEPPEFVREINTIIPLGTSGNYITIPLPLGYNVLPNTGRVLTEFAMSGWRDPSKRISEIVGAFMDMFNPLGSAGWSAQTIAPTAADPIVALSENRDWTGKPIAKEDFSNLDPTPGYTRAKETASLLGGKLSYVLNMMTGGTDFKPGILSPTPDQIDYLFGQVTGGVGREANKIVDSVKNMATGEETPPYKIPLVGRFYGNTLSGAAESSRFYSNIRELNMHENEIKGRRESGGDVMGYIRDNPEARMFSRANKTHSQVRDLRKRRTKMLEHDAGRESIKMVEAQITARMKQFNDEVRRLREGVPGN